MTLPIPIDWSSCSFNDVPTLSCLPPLITGFITWALIAAGIIAIFIVIYAGYKYINSGGDPKQADTARKTLIYAIFGLLIIFMSFFIVRAIGQITGLEKNCYSQFGFTNCATDSSSTSDSDSGPNPPPLKCKPTEDRKCTFRNFGCKCVPKAPSEKKCITYGAGASECGRDKYCNSDKICADLPKPQNDLIFCNEGKINGITLGFCEPKDNPSESKGGYGTCVSRFNQNIPNCSVPYTCVCQYPN